VRGDAFRFFGLADAAKDKEDGREEGQSTALETMVQSDTT